MMSLDVIIVGVVLAVSAWYWVQDMRPARSRGPAGGPGPLEGPGPAPRGPGSVKASRPRKIYRKRSERSNGGERVQGRSGPQDAVNAGSNVQSVQPPPPSPATPAGASGAAAEVLTLTEQEVKQLARAVALRAGGATKQAAIEQAFGVSKGGSQGWRRASQLLDMAMGGE